MFWQAGQFNSDIENWDVSNVTDMFGMFTDANSFNQDISTFDISSVINMEQMFDGAGALSEEKKCAIHTSFSSNDAWLYGWSASCDLTLTEFSLSPVVFVIHQNYPNPFNQTTQIRYDLPEDALVNITIYDIMSRSIRSLVNSIQTADYRSTRWDGKNNLGEGVSAGMYIYMIQAGWFRHTKKMVLLK